MERFRRFWKAAGAFTGGWLAVFAESLATQGEITEETIVRAALVSLLAAATTAAFPKNADG